MSVHYKFKSSLDYDTVTFDGLHISVGDLKKAIIQQKRIGKNTDFDLQVTNAQTKEVYNDEGALIPKNTSLVIARIPQAAQPNKGRGVWNENSTVPGFQSRPAEDATAAPLSKAVDLSRLDASEEDKIRAMMTQSTLDYDPSNYMKIRGANQMGEVPANYRCFKCHQPGHWIKNCPLGVTQEAVEIKKSTGIPRSFMVPVEGPMVPGAMMTPTGQYAVPALDHQAYNSDGGGRGAVESEQRPDIPEDLLCNICKDLLTDAVMIPCCGNSFCDECIRTTLLESEDHECPDCHEKDISPGTLIPNRFLRNSVSNFRNETGYRKRQQYRHAVPKPQPESTTEEQPSKPPPITLADFVPPTSDEVSGTTNVTSSSPDQKPVISEADSTESSTKQTPVVVVEDTKSNVQTSPKKVSIPIKAEPDVIKLETPTEVKSETGLPISSLAAATVPQGQAITSVSSGVVQPKINVHSVRSTDPPNGGSRSSQYRSTGVITSHLPIAPAPAVFVPMSSTEERPGTPTIDEPGIGVSQPSHSHAVPAYPPGDTPPFLSPPDPTNIIPVTAPGPPPSGRPLITSQHPSYSQHAVYAPAPVTNTPPTYAPPYAPPPRVPPPTQGTDYNAHVRPFIPRVPYEQVRPPPIGPYDPARPPPPVYSAGYPPRPGLSVAGPRPPYGSLSLRNPPPGIRPPHNGGVIDDPLAAFERMLREKDERDRRVRESRRSRSRSYSPRSRRTRSSSRSRSYSPRSRTPRSRSPPPKPKLRNRSRTPRSISRSRSRSRPILRRSRSPRSRDRSFSLSRSRSYSRSPSPREYSPRRRPVSRNRYRSPPPRNSPPRYRYPERRPIGPERERPYSQRSRDRDYGSYYDGPPSSNDYNERDRERIRNDREKEFDRDRPVDRRLPSLSSRGSSRTGPPGARYLPSPTIRKEYPLGMLPQNQPTYYSVQEHAVYHHQNQPSNRYQAPSGSGRMGSTYPPALMSVKTVMPPMEDRHYDPPAPPGTEEPTVPGFESPRLMRYERQPPISDAPPGVDPHAADTVLTKPLDIDRPTKDMRAPRDSRDGTRDTNQRELRDSHDNRDKRDVRDRNRSHDHPKDRERRERKNASPEWRYNRDIESPNHVNVSKERQSRSPDKHHHRHKYDSPDKEKERDKRNNDQDKERSGNDKRTKDSSEDDKTKNRSKDKKKRKKEKEAEKSKKKEERKKRKEQEKLKKAEEKKSKTENETNNQDKVHDKPENAGPKIQEVSACQTEDKSEVKVNDLYSDVLSEGIDTKVVQNYGKLHAESKSTSQKGSSSPHRTPNTETLETIEEKDMSFDGLDLHVSENDILKQDQDSKLKDKEVLAPLPALSKWEVDEDTHVPIDKKECIDENTEAKEIFEKSSNKIVTSEVLKHAENAIFKKAINAIRPIEIKKISLDRAKLYSGEKHVEAGAGSPSRITEKDVIAPSNIQVTIPTSDWEMRLVDINPSAPTSIDQRRPERDISSAVQKPAATRLSVRERLGSKVDELDKITKEDRPYDRNRSRTLSPLSRRERDETNRNSTLDITNRRIVEIDDRRRPTSKHESAWRNRDHERKPSTRIERSRSRERTHRDTRRLDSRGSQYRRDDARRDDRRERREHDRHDGRNATKKVERKPESKDDRQKDDKHKERQKMKRSRSRSISRDKGVDRNKIKKKDKKHKKEREKVKKHKKDDELETRDSSKRITEATPEREKKSNTEAKDVFIEKKITERRKPTLDEANFEPDYDALDTESESEEKNKQNKKRDRSKTPDSSLIKKRKVDEMVKKVSKSKEQSSSSESSSETSSSEEEKHKKKHKKHKKRKTSKKVSSSSSSDSDSNSSSDDDSKKRRNKTKKHKNSKKTVKKKKKSKHK